MKATLLHNQDISELESILIREGMIVPAPAAELMKFGQNALSVFCITYGVYQIPTTELITFIQSEIAGHPAIEIGSGNGCIGRALKIPRTDNKMQEWPEIVAYYKLLQQPVVHYAPDVAELPAITAVKSLKPKIVVACWVTHLLKPGMKFGNAYGVDEVELFQHGVEKYIHIGNKGTHQEKPILKNAHFEVKTLSPTWLLSRSMQTKDNVIYIITKRR